MGSDTYKQNQTDDIDDHWFKQTCSWKANLCCVQQLLVLPHPFHVRRNSCDAYSDAYQAQIKWFTHRLMVNGLAYVSQTVLPTLYIWPTKSKYYCIFMNFPNHQNCSQNTIDIQVFCHTFDHLCWHNWLADFPLFLGGGGKMGRWEDGDVGWTGWMP